MRTTSVRKAVRKAASVGLILGASTVWAACSDEAGFGRRPVAQPASSPTEMSAMAPAPAPAAPERDQRMLAADAVAFGGSTQDAPRSEKSASGQVVLPTSGASSMIIRNGNASVEVDSLELAITRVKEIVTRVGGYLANSGIATGEHQVRSATLELKIPAARFEEVVNGLSPLGKIESVVVTAEDVGEEFVDVTARVANARRLEERLVTLLATRTGKLEDVLAVERELARVREEIERYEGRLRFLKTRVAISTLSITVHEKPPVVTTDPGQNIIGDAFLDAWRNFVRFTAGVIASLGWLVPLAVLAALAVLGLRKLQPKVRVNVRAAAAEPPARAKETETV